MEHNSDKWWHHCSTILRYMPGEDGKSIMDIEAELAAVSASGYQAIQITAPYKSAGFYPWWGLRPYDYFGVNEVLDGTMEDFKRLVDKCHEYGLRVLLFLNIGYADVTSPLWKKACQDKRAGIFSRERELFLWSDSKQDSLEQLPGMHFLQGGGWHESEEAQSSYWCKWKEQEFAEPQYDWNCPQTAILAESVLEHWLKTGGDGIIVDAVNWYLNCSMEKIQRHITDVIHRYPDVMCIPEGGTGFGDSFLPWVVEGGFDVVEDQNFHSDLWWNYSFIMKALENQNPELLEEGLQVCREARSQGVVCWSYLSWGEQWTPSFRLLEIALLVATGHMTEIIPSYLYGFQNEHMEMLKRILRMSYYRALSPVNERIRIRTEGSTSCYALLCQSKEEPVLCVFNLSEEPQQICMDIAGAEIEKKMWQEHINRKIVYAENGNVQLEIGGFEFAFLTVI